MGCAYLRAGVPFHTRPSGRRPTNAESRGRETVGNREEKQMQIDHNTNLSHGVRDVEKRKEKKKRTVTSGRCISLP
jgi:hypothetical protein